VIHNPKSLNCWANRNIMQNCNIRPSDGTGNAGQSSAMQQHLIDFRTHLVEAWALIRSLQAMVAQLLDLKNDHEIQTTKENPRASVGWCAVPHAASGLWRRPH